MARFPIPQGSLVVHFLYSANRPIDVRDESVRRVLFSIHGKNGEGSEYLDRAADAAAGVPGATEETIIVAPYFKNKPAAGEAVDPEVLTWDGSHWWGGYSSSALVGSQQISSFEVLDRLVAATVNRFYFPNLRKFVMVGHSGGGQLINRYAASSAFLRTHAQSQGVQVHFIPMNPGNYLYMSNRRRIGGTGDTIQFGIPTENCPNYDNYGRGLSALTYYPSEMGMTPTKMRELYRTQRVTYLAGSEDNVHDDDLPDGCGDMLQGANRLERAQTYMAHIRATFGDLKRQRMLVVPDAGHNGRRMMNSTVGRAAIFEPAVEPTVEVFALDNNGQPETRVDSRVWSNGWTQALTYATGGQSYLFLLKEGTGDVHLHKLNEDGVIGEEIQRYDWDAGWTSAAFFSNSSGLYLLLYKRGDGRLAVHRIKDDGRVGLPVLQPAVEAGWRTVVPFTVGSSQFVFFMNSESRVEIRAVNSAGRLDASGRQYGWTPHWTSATFYTVPGDTYLAILKEADGKFHSHRMNADGSVGPRLETEDWTSGWTHMLPCQVGSRRFLMFHKREEGRIDTRRIGPDAKLGATRRTDWPPLWTSFATFTGAGNTYLLALKKERIES